MKTREMIECQYRQHCVINAMMALDGVADWWDSICSAAYPTAGRSYLGCICGWHSINPARPSVPFFFFRTGRRRRSAAAALNIQLAINSQGAAAARRTHTQKKKKKNNFKRRRQRLLVRSRAEASRPTRGGRRIVIWPQMTIDPPPLLWGLPT